MDERIKFSMEDYTQHKKMNKEDRDELFWNCSLLQFLIDL